MLHCWPSVCNSVLHPVQLLIQGNTYTYTQIHKGRPLNERWGIWRSNRHQNSTSNQTSHLGNTSRLHFSFVFSTFLDILLHGELFADPLHPLSGAEHFDENNQRGWESLAMKTLWYLQGLRASHCPHVLTQVRGVLLSHLDERNYVV